MEFYGLQKCTLLDYPGKVACTVFTGGCNFRCPYCHNSELVLRPQGAIDESEILAFLQKRQKILDGICVTGGEPLMYDLTGFLRQVRAMGYCIKLDTNGSYPQRLKQLVLDGLIDYVAMDIKSSPNGYALASGVTVDLDAVRQSVEFLLSDAVDYEFRTTVVRELHSEADFIAIGKWLKGAKRYYLQAFKDSEFVPQHHFTAYTYAEMENFCNVVRRDIDTVAVRGLDA